MDFGAQPIVGAAQVAIEGYSTVALALRRTNLLSRSEVLETVGKHIGVRIAENERAELHDGDEARKVEDLGVGITAVKHTGQVEELSTLVNFCPEAFLQSFLGRFEGRGLLDEVEVGEHADDFGEAMRLEDVEELERFLGRVRTQNRAEHTTIGRTISNP